MNFAKWMLIPAAITTMAVAAPSIPTTPAAVRDIVYARPFTLQTGYQSDWRTEKPTVTEGWLVVVQSHTEFTYPRQGPEPILFAGSDTAERVNVGYPSGITVAIVPGAFDPSTSKIWWGTPGLPEQVDAKKLAEEITAADAAGVRPLGAEKAAKARGAGGESIALADRDALLREAAQLIKRYSPAETEQADTIFSAAGGR